MVTDTASMYILGEWQTSVAHSSAWHGAICQDVAYLESTKAAHPRTMKPRHIQSELGHNILLYLELKRKLPILFNSISACSHSNENSPIHARTHTHTQTPTHAQNPTYVHSHAQIMVLT